MIGAVVGVQPFGGEGKSGTGPKAGGPLYLHRLLRQAPLCSGGYRRRAGEGERYAGALQALAEWAQQNSRGALAELCMEYADRTPLVHSIPLQGPTGRVIRSSSPHAAKLLCVANDEAALLRQIAAVLATGNRVVLAGGSWTARLLDTLPLAVREQIRIEPDWIRAPSATMATLAGCFIPVHPRKHTGCETNLPRVKERWCR